MTNTYIELKQRYENSSLKTIKEKQSEILALRLENAKLKLRIKELERNCGKNENFND